MTISVRDINQTFWCSKRIPYLTIRTTFDSSQGYKAHSHSEFSIGIIESGETCLTIGEQQIILKQGDVILIEPRKVHACNPIGGYSRSYYMLYLDSNWCCEMLSILYGYEVREFVCEQNMVTSGDENNKLAGLVHLLLEEESKQHALEVEQALFYFVSRYCLPLTLQENDNELAYKVRDRLLADVAYAPSIKEMALDFGRAEESLIRNFKRRFGITPKSFLANHRIEKAKLLLKSGMNIVDVAIEVGYSDQSQLHRAFVNYTASTPRQYQQLTSIFDNNG